MEPPYGEEFEVKIPSVWTTKLDNGIAAYGIENNETPLVEFVMRIKGGLLLEEPDHTGVSNFLAQMLMAGTANKTAAELEEAIDQLGASIQVVASSQDIKITGNTLARNYEATMGLVEEILLNPRWDESEFNIIQQRIFNQLRQAKASPRNIANNAFNKLVFGEENILSRNRIGTMESIEAMTMEDLQAYYKNKLSPEHTAFHVAGFISKDQALTPLLGLASSWEQKEIKFPEFIEPSQRKKIELYFVDIPNAKQSVIRVGYLALSETDNNFVHLSALNHELGGDYVSELNRALRVEKGYTYGAYSSFSGSDIPGPFVATTSVRSNVTYESLEIIRDIITTYPDDYSEEYLDNTKEYLIKSSPRRFETLGAKLEILEKISAYGWSHNYPKEQEDVLRNLTLEEMKELADTYIDLDRMILLIVG